MYRTLLYIFLTLFINIVVIGCIKMKMIDSFLTQYLQRKKML